MRGRGASPSGVDAVIASFLGRELAALGAMPLPLPPRMPRLGIAVPLHTPSAGMPAITETIAPRRAAA